MNKRAIDIDNYFNCLPSIFIGIEDYVNNKAFYHNKLIRIMESDMGDSDKMKSVILNNPRYFLAKKRIISRFYKVDGELIDYIFKKYDFISKTYEIFNNNVNLQLSAGLMKIFPPEISNLIYSYLPAGVVLIQVFYKNKIIRDIAVEIGSYLSINVLQNFPLLILNSDVMIKIKYYPYNGWSNKNLTIYKITDASSASLEHRYRIIRENTCHTKNFIFCDGFIKFKI